MLCRAAKASGVHMTTADSESELYKIAAVHPAAQVLLRIRQDDPSARCQLGNKYGAEAHDIEGEQLQTVSAVCSCPPEGKDISNGC